MPYDIYNYNGYRFIDDELIYIHEDRRKEFQKLYGFLSDKQIVYEEILDVVLNDKYGIFLCVWFWRYWKNLPMEYNFSCYLI